MFPYSFVGIFLTFQGHLNQPFFIIIQAWSASLWLVVVNLAHFPQISIILFRTLFVYGCSKYNCEVQVCCLPFSALVRLIWVVAKVVGCVHEKRPANIRMMPEESSKLVIKGASTDHDTQTCCVDPTLNYVLISEIGWYIQINLV